MSARLMKIRLFRDRLPARGRAAGYEDVSGAPPPMHRPTASNASVALLVMAVMAAVSGGQGAAAKEPVVPPGHVLPAAYLAGLTPPEFAPGHTLPRLTRYGGIIDLDTRIDFARRFGYALQWGPVAWGAWNNGYTLPADVDEALANPASDGGRCIRLAAEQPDVFKLSVVCVRDLPRKAAVPPETWTRDAAGRFLVSERFGQDGNTWSDSEREIYSPLAPDSVWREAGRLRAEQIARIRKHCPIAIVLNGGEYGLGPAGAGRPYWEKDPTIVAAKGERSWFEFVSAAKGRAEKLIADAVRAAAPDRELYVFYCASGGPGRHQFPNWQEWSFGYEWLADASDLPSSEHYYRQFNSGWTGDADLLSRALNARGHEIARGRPLSYDWLSAGWEGNAGSFGGERDTEHDGGQGDISRYRGFLACLYTAGMVGGNAGYYAYPKGYEGTPLQGFRQPFPPDKPPHWLKQMIALADVHATFSHLERYLRDGDLLPGPDRHRWSKDQPAHEFPTGHAGTRVLARKIKGQPEWLITAWAADGVVRDVTVEIPELGQVNLRARPEATLRTATLVDGRPRLADVESRQTVPAARTAPP